MNKKNLDEVSFMRPILIVLVVLYHAMAIHTGNWSLPEGTQEIGAYAAVGRIAYIFMLESFVFMSGYVWAYQRSLRGEEPFSTLVKKKAMRLLVPCYLFGVIYALSLGQGDTLGTNTLSVLTGIGHLWFLFMLFVCFIVLWTVLKVEPVGKLGGVFLLFMILALFSFFDLPFQLSNIMYYMLFFFMGFTVYGYRNEFMQKSSGYSVLLAWVVFLALYVVLNYVRGYCISHIGEGLVVELIKKGCRLGYTISGMMAFYMTSVWVVNKIKLPQWYIDMGAMCFGVYIFQQFTLEIIYYNSPIVDMMGAYLLPWVAFAITFVMSILLTWAIRLTSFGMRFM